MKKIGNIVLSIIGLIVLYLGIGNLYRGITGVTLIGEDNAHFLGYYMIASAYFVLLIIVILFVILINWKRGKRVKKNTCKPSKL